jgi:hypothetical protein
MKKILGILAAMVILMYAGFASATCPDSCEAFWQSATQYTDNTAIEPADLPLSYVAEWDGTLLPATTALAVPIPKPYGHNVQHTLRVKSVTAKGVGGPFSPPFSWTSPVGIPKSPPGTGGGVR